jgi:hypothetical protein
MSGSAEALHSGPHAPDLLAVHKARVVYETKCIHILADAKEAETAGNELTAFRLRTAIEMVRRASFTWNADRKVWIFGLDGDELDLPDCPSPNDLI